MKNEPMQLVLYCRIILINGQNICTYVFTAAFCQQFIKEYDDDDDDDDDENSTFDYRYLSQGKFRCTAHI